MEVSFDCTQLCAHAETEEFALSFCAPEFMASINIIYCCIAVCRPAREDVRLLVRTPVGQLTFYGVSPAFGSGRNRMSNKITLALPDNMADQFEPARRRFISAIQ